MRAHEPSEAEKQTLILASLAAITASAHRGEGTPPYTPEMFMTWKKQDAAAPPQRRGRSSAEIKASYQRAGM